MKIGRIIISSIILVISGFMANFINKFIYNYHQNRNAGNLENIYQSFGIPLKSCQTAINPTTDNFMVYMQCDGIKNSVNFIFWLFVFASVMFLIYWLIIQFMRRLNGY